MDRRDGPLARALDLGHTAFWMLALTGIVVFLATTWLSARERSREAADRIAALRQEVAAAKEANAQLAAEKEGLTSDPVHIERMLRRRFHWMAADEFKVEPEEPAVDGP